MMAQKRGDIPYLLGLIFFIASIVYFFASNWPGFERPVKISLILTLLVASAAAALFYRRSKLFSYLSNWWMVLSVLVFAVAVALIGQMYNSHADSYMLFLITFIPAAFLALLTRYHPLYWLAFLLFEFTLWLWLYPTGSFIFYSTGEQLLIYLGMATFHFVIYLFWMKVKKEKLALASLLVIQFCFLYLLLQYTLYQTLSGETGFLFVFLLLHLLYIAFITLFWKAFTRSQKHHPVKLAVHIICFGLYAVWNVFHFWFEIMGEYIFYAGFPMLLILFALSILGLKKLTASASSHETKWRRYTISFFTGALAFIGTIIAVSSLSSFVSLIFGWDNDFSISFLVLSILCIGAGLAFRRKSWLVVRVTLQITGVVFAFLYVTVKWGTSWPAFLIAVPFAVLAFALFHKKESVLYYIAANAAFIYGILRLLSENGVSFSVSTWVLFGAAAVNALAFLFLKRQLAGLAAFWLSLVFGFYALTEDGWDALMLHILFLAYIVLHLLHPVLKTRWYRWPIWGALITFLVWKYYEFAWLLVHKSISFLLISALFFGIWFVWGRRHTTLSSSPTWRPAIFSAVIAVQCLFLLAAVWEKEQLLARGDIIALELVPVDPRSILQGDYVQLGYAIQEEYQKQNFEQSFSFPEGKIKAILAPTNKMITYKGQGIPVYTATDFTKKSEGNEELFLTGNARGGTISFGIEHFFIPENTGEVWEEKTHAIVRVAENGDALLETLR